MFYENSLTQLLRGRVGWLVGMHGWDAEELLCRMLGQSSDNYEELLTILYDCEAVINSKPLTCISNSPDELMILTPAIFLVNDNCTKLENIDLDAALVFLF